MPPSRHSDTEPLVFISYRRSERSPVIHQIREYLRRRYGDVVFLDEASVPPGERWPDRLDAALQSADVVVAVIGPQWYGPLKGPNRRIDQPSDWVRREMEIALREGKPVIPVFLDTHSTLDADLLPPHLKSLATIQGCFIGVPGDLDRLSAALESSSDRLRTIPRHFWDAPPPDIDRFHGRARELTMVHDWIVKDRCRFVTILGFACTGKSSFAYRLVRGPGRNLRKAGPALHALKDVFDFVCWCSLQGYPPLDRLLSRMIEQIADDTRIRPAEDLTERIEQLSSLLRSKRCLIVFDNAEDVFGVPGFDEAAREWAVTYGRLFAKLIEPQGESCVLVTTRVLPRVIEERSGEGRHVRHHRLLPLETAPAKALVTSIADVRGSTPAWDRLVQSLGGNPKALQLTAPYIAAESSGEIGIFLQKEKLIFDDVEKIFSWHFIRIPDDEMEILYWLSVHREPVSTEILEDCVLGSRVGQRGLESIISALRRRFLIETTDVEHGGGGFFLQPGILEIVTRKMAKTLYDELKTERLDYFNRVCLVKVSGTDHAADAQRRLLVGPLAAQLLEDEDGRRASLPNRVRRLFDCLRERGVRSGYGAGNLINLSSSLGLDLVSFDFSELTVREADLTEVQARHVNLSGVHLWRCKVTDSFGSVLSVAFDPSGTRLVAANADRMAYVYSVPHGKTHRILDGHENWVQGVAWSHDGQYIATCGADHTVRLWEAAHGQLLKTFIGHQNWVRNVDFSPRGDWLVSSSEDGTLALWNVPSRTRAAIFEDGGPIWCCRFSNDGRWLASAGADGVVRVRSLQPDGTWTLREMNGLEGYIYAVDFSHDDAWLLAGGATGTVGIWRTRDWSYCRTLCGDSAPIRGITTSRRPPHFVYAAQGNGIQVWSLETFERLPTLGGHTNHVWSVAIHPTADVVASGSEDQSIRLWDPHAGAEVKRLQGSTHAMRAVRFIPGTREFVSGGDDGILRWWDAEEHADPTLELVGHGSRIRALAISRDTLLVASGSEDLTVRLWQRNTIDWSTRELRGHTHRVRGIAIDADRQFVVSSSDDSTIRVWNATNGECLHVLEGHIDRVLSVAFAPTGFQLASGSDDGTIKLWDAKAGVLLATLHGHEGRVISLAYDPEGQRLVSGSENGGLELWDLEKRECAGAIGRHEKRVWTVAFSPAGDTIASGGEDRDIKVWDAKTRRLVMLLKGHDNWVQSLDFSSDGALLVSCSEDETIRVWRLASDREKEYRVLRIARQYEGANIRGVEGLTPAEKRRMLFLGAIED